MSCEADIPPEYVHAISSNTCAGCGGAIMNTTAKTLMDELADAMERMPNNPRGIAGWLISNYRFEKIGEARPVERFHSVKERDVKVAQRPRSNEFLERTGVARSVVETQEKLQQLAQGNKKFAALAKGIREIEAEEEQLEQEDSMYESDEYDEEEYIEPPRPSRAITRETIVDPRVKPPSSDEITSIAKEVGSELSFESGLPEEYVELERLKRVKAQNALMGGRSFKR